MDIATAQLPAQSGDDRILTTPDSVIVLDGASSFAPGIACAGDFVDALGNELERRARGAHDELQAVLYQAIADTADKLNLTPGSSPSSTVAILHVNMKTVDVLVLGDSPVIVGRNDGSYETILDDRLSQLRLPETQRYRSRLHSGTGYDEEHRAILAELQRSERIHRNRQGGYWIAEADPAAANQALVARYMRQDIAWAILATDGAADPLAPLGISWPQVARMDTGELSALLARCHQWESVDDPHGQQHPRAKRHDDKTIAVVQLPPHGDTSDRR
jgi:serine/threonine protein phosphatase PrpC